MGGDLEKIRKVGEYLLEVWKAAGVDLSRVEVVWAATWRRIQITGSS
ncbi:MAG: hypothetical protein QXU12_04185 [Nitrososphaerota archaeon]